MDSDDQLRLIRDARGDRALLALATVDLTFPGLPAADRAALRSALAAAAVPHWCDAAVLTALTGSDDRGSGWWARLQKVPVVEPFPARGADAGNVHEASRLAVRKHLAEKQRDRFVELSSRAARLFEADDRPSGRIEWVYHLMVADPERGTDEVEALGRSLWLTARHEDLAALTAAMAELDVSEVLSGRASVQARLIVAQRRAYLAGATSIGELGDELLRAAEATGDARLTGDAYSLVGDVARARGDLPAAEWAHRQDLAISQRLADLNPTDASRQQDLGQVHLMVGDVAKARGNLTAAEQAYARCRDIAQRLADGDPANLASQHDLAVAHSRLGDVADARNDLAAAEQAYTRYRAIFHRLSELDPANTNWQRELAVAYTQVGDVASARGDLAAADEAYRQDLAISQRLADLDPTNTGWQRDLAITLGRLGGVALKRGDLPAAAQAYGQFQAITQRLATRDPTNTDWQWDLAIATYRLGTVAREQGDQAAAEQAFRRYQAMIHGLVELDASNTAWQRELTFADSLVADITGDTG
ncbi:hypothetical protein HH310_14025 [Actinoplanes sp. TBRC 11911]|uniref:tetratricopeptide repeat protein n=1 Tax=Actinoplanes sp. TBRC 11911 TaxID=2729386 RepID=UPI00145E4F93|nr:tetratricopeptide repeat protein [Actinoplanes sp. TBRC 11911]NMO52311.1 hypothetical protein [Actinoplanes sp. TBRC 11911]